MSYKTDYIELNKYLSTVMECHEDLLKDILIMLDDGKVTEVYELIQSELSDMDGWDK